MKCLSLPATLLLAIASIVPSFAQNHASAVIEFQPGTGSTPGYHLTPSVLGSPARLTPGEFGGPVDPFNPPWQPEQLLSLGAGGYLTLQFAYPVPNHSDHAYGIDFVIHGSAGFLIVNGDYSGGGITDGSLFGSLNGVSRVSVSLDGVQYYPLNPSQAPLIDQWFPTDGSGDFTRPVNPALREADFAGRGLDGIRELYAGSGGGAGFDIAWATDDSGTPVALEHIQFVRIDVLSDRAEIDALTAVPEPAIAPIAALGLVLLLRFRRSAAPTTFGHSSP